MNKKTLSLLIGSLAAAQAAFAAPITLIDNSTLGRYNSSLGTTLDGSNPFGGNYMFPGPNVSQGDPSLDIPASSAPNLSAVSAQLGNWLSNPAAPGGTWSAPQAIPGTWAVNDETAIIYTVTLGGTVNDVVASFGVDNGVFLWVDGQFQGAYLRPGGASAGEHAFNLGTLSAGTHYFQVLREDHGGATGYSVSVTGDVPPVPEPSTLALVGLGIAGLGLAYRRRKI